MLGNVAGQDHVAVHLKGHVLPLVHGNESRHVGSSVDLLDRAEPYGLSGWSSRDRVTDPSTSSAIAGDADRGQTSDPIGGITVRTLLDGTTRELSPEHRRQGRRVHGAGRRR